MGGLYANENILQVLFVTGILGGGAAFLSGRALALTWRPLWHILLYMVGLGLVVRFMHFALFGGTLLSLPSCLADIAVCLGFAWLGFRTSRAGQMATQYRWLYARAGWLGWRLRPAQGPNAAPDRAAKSG